VENSSKFRSGFQGGLLEFSSKEKDRSTYILPVGGRDKENIFCRGAFLVSDFLSDAPFNFFSDCLFLLVLLDADKRVSAGLVPVIFFPNERFKFDLSLLNRVRIEGSHEWFRGEELLKRADTLFRHTGI